LLKKYKLSASGALLHVEKTLRHLALPDLDKRAGKNPEMLNLITNHTEVKDLTDWLKEKYHVDQIYSLSVPDREREPHDEDTIARICDDFKVVKMDWRRLDMSARTLRHSPYEADKEYTQDSLKCLYLYTSGNAAVLNEWFGEHGLSKLPHVLALLPALGLPRC
jgi:hypothetical protein